MFTPGRVAITLIALLVAVILYWVTKVLSVGAMALVEVNFTNWPIWGQLTFQAFPVLALIFLFVWAFRQLNPERELGQTEPPNPFRAPGAAVRLMKKTQGPLLPFSFGSGGSKKVVEPEEPSTIAWEKSPWSSNPLGGKFVVKKKKKRGSKDAFDF